MLSLVIRRFYRVYQNQVNSLKNACNLKSMKVMVKIFFYLDSLKLVFPTVAKSLLCDNDILAYFLLAKAGFVSQAKKQLRQVNKTQNRSKINLRM